MLTSDESALTLSERQGWLCTAPTALLECYVQPKRDSDICVYLRSGKEFSGSPDASDCVSLPAMLFHFDTGDFSPVLLSVCHMTRHGGRRTPPTWLPLAPPPMPPLHV
ncbi:hypothetical protein J6590_017792 [Homalodisca vitripennis]|nr:hypothetical protein J6590_017792 [Homalodisca vitripennis]